MKELLKTAVEASLEAGKRIMEIYENEDFEVDFKGDDSPLTKADLASHKIIMGYLQDTGIPVLSEEGKHMDFAERKDWSKLWIVDPIDGTKEFIKRNGEFTVNIALIQDQKPILGVIYVPALQDLYFADKENGSYKAENVSFDASFENIVKNGRRLPLQSERTQFTVVASKSHLSQETVEYIDELKSKHGDVDSISKGSSLKLCMVAEGAADEYPRFAPTMEWDTAAAQAVLEGAGGKVLRVDNNEPLHYNKEDLLNPYFIAQGNMQ